ncbi:MAG TPA: hypothetical protein VJX91_04615 [Candidatus Eisenbacteria bacterium]|nr:hypothetical protein [Candidatus Eisenbacteria bacterium]
MESVDRASNPGTLVAEPPPQTRWLLPLVFLGGVAYAWYLWIQAAQGERVRLEDWLFPGIAILCGPLWLFNGNRRIVMNHARIAEYRGRRMLRQYSLREITAVRPEYSGLKVIFADGRTIGIPNAWAGASDIRHYLQTVVDVRVAAAPPMDDWLPLNYLTFPSRCVSCGSDAVVEHRIFAGTNYTLPNVHVTRGWQIPVPVCRRCSQHRKAMGAVAAILMFGGAIGLVVAAIWASQRFPGIHAGPIDSLGVLFLIAFTMFFVMTHMARNQVPRWLDQRLLGIAAMRLGKDRTTVRLWFRDRQMEIEVRTLTAERRAQEMSSAAGMLRAV